MQTNSKGEEESLMGVAITSVSFGLWCCPLKNVNKDSTVTPEKFYEKRKKKEEAKQKALEAQKRIEQPFIEPPPRQDNPVQYQPPQTNYYQPMSNPSGGGNMPQERNFQPPINQQNPPSYYGNGMGYPNQ